MEKALPVLLVGDGCTDVFTYVSQINRENPEAPTAPLYEVVDSRTSGGMTHFVHACMSNLGMHVKKFTTSNMTTTYKLGTIKHRLVDHKSGNQILRFDEDIKDQVPLNVRELPPKDLVAAVVVSDYNKGFITDQTLHDLADKYGGLPLFLDTKKANLSDFKRFVIKVNKKEANAAASVCNLQEIPELIITLGDKGAYWSSTLTGKTTILHHSPYNVRAVDTCGAGDAFMAGLVYGYLNNPYGRYLGRAIDFGMANAAISVTKAGTYAPTLKEVEHIMIMREAGYND